MSKTSIWLSAVSLFLIFSGSRAVMAQQERPDDITVLANARLISGDGSVLENAFVVIRGESILSVSTEAPRSLAASIDISTLRVKHSCRL